MLLTSPPWRRQGSTNSQIKGRIGKAGRTEDRVLPKRSPLTAGCISLLLMFAAPMFALVLCQYPAPPIFLPRTPSTPLLVHVHRQH